MRFSKRTAPDFAKIDEHLLRWTAFLDTVVLTSLMITRHWFFMALLVYEFAHRVFHPHRISILTFISGRIIASLNLQTRLIYKAPKSFGARVGFFMALALGWSLILSNTSPVLFFGLVFMVNCLLLTAFGICPACFVYSAMNKYRLKLSPSLQYERLVDNM